MFDFFKKKDENIENENNTKGFFGISFDSLKSAVSKTGEALVDNITSVVQGKEEIDGDMLDEIEERLIRADIGLNTAVEITDKIRKSNIKASQMTSFLKDEFSKILAITDNTDLNILENQQNIILVTGVNGAGKTTLIGKLAYKYKNQGKKVIVAAGDTFRAAAEEQLEIWSQRAGVQIIQKPNADPASVVFEAIREFKNTGADILIIDTAGRLQNKFNLMEELGKIKRVIDKEAAGLLRESLLVIDANTGQNGLKQAEVFNQIVNTTAVGLTKLDGSAKGGIILAIAKDLKIPVKLIGVGEKIEDLRSFNPQDFVNALFE